MRPLISLLAVLLVTQPIMAETYVSSPTQLKKKIIYARAAGEVTQVSLREGQVFLWDELAASIKPSQNVRPEFGRAYSDFAGAVKEVFVRTGDRVEKGAPLFECRFLENVYASCVVPSSLNVAVDQPVQAIYQGEIFEGKVLSTQKDGASTYVNVLIHNSHEGRYWHLTHDVRVSIKF
ncbi:MAG: hypothetical protein IT423_20630 [Pirellulaceae bacterium]|nr:hypothetical protein [Pirellulaceae bacterium]